MAEHDESLSPGPDLSDYLAAIKRRRMLLACIALPILAIAAALAVGLPNIYVSTGLFTFTDATVPGEMPANANADGIQRLEEQYRDAYVDSLASTVMSDASIKDLIQQVPGLVPPGTDLATAVKEVKRRARVETVRTPVLDPNTGRNLDIISAFTVSYESADPALAARGARWLSNAFVEANRQGRLVSAKAAEQFYDTQTQIYRQQISQIESKLATFKSKNYDQLPGLTNLNMGIMQTTQQQIDTLTQQIGALRQNRVFLEEQLDTARNAGQDQGLLAQLQAEYDRKLATYDPDYPDMIALRQQIDELQEGGGAENSLSLPAQLQADEQALAQSRLRYSENFPDVKRLERQIQILKTRIAHGEKYAGNAVGSPAVIQLRTQLNANQTQTEALQRQSDQMRQQLLQLEGRVEAAPQVEREYKSLALNLQLAQTKYNQLLKYQMDAAAHQPGDRERPQRPDPCRGAALRAARARQAQADRDRGRGTDACDPARTDGGGDCRECRSERARQPRHPSRAGALARGRHPGDPGCGHGAAAPPAGGDADGVRVRRDRRGAGGGAKFLLLIREAARRRGKSES